MPTLYLRIWKQEKPEGLREIKLETGSTSLGRERDNRVRLDEEGVSRHHAQIQVNGSDVLLVDSNSTNGTWVNGKRIMRRRLSVGDQFTIGSLFLELADCSFSASTVIKPELRQPVATPELHVRQAADIHQKAESAASQSSVDSFRLRWRHAGEIRGKWQDARLDAIPFQIGRDPTCNLILDDTMVSRFHARIEAAPEGLHLIDMGSANGIFIKNQRIERKLLQHGDEFHLGPFDLIFEKAGDPAPLEQPKRARADAGPPPQPVLGQRVERISRPGPTPAGLPESFMAGPDHQASRQPEMPDLRNIICQWCHMTLPPDAVFCGSCGGELAREGSGRSCPKCSGATDSRHRYCAACGSSL